MLEASRMLVVIFSVLFFVAGVQEYGTLLDGVAATIIAIPFIFGLYVVSENCGR